jgi:hypothetical protein
MTLHEIGLKHGTDKATYHGYCDYYERKLHALKTGTGALLELGIYKGASLAMWEEWLPNLSIFGVDIDTSRIDRPFQRAKIGVLDCGDEMAMRKWAVNVLAQEKQNRFRCVIDDASHQWAHQYAAFRALWPLTDIYVIEDIHTSLRKEYGREDLKPVLPSMGSPLNLDFGCSVKISYFEGRTDNSWTVIIERV